MRRNALLFFVGGGVLLAGLAPVRALDELQTLSPAPSAGPPKGAYRPGELIVAFRDGVDERGAAAALRGVGGRAARRAAFAGHWRVTLDDDVGVPEAVRRLSALAEVDYAEPNGYVYKHQGSTFSPNDRQFRIQWNFRMIGATRTWAIQKGSADVAIAVLDTGVAYEDFGAFRKAPDWGNVRFLPGIDTVNGDSHANDDELHGTHVASTVAEATNNELQVTGLAFGCSIMPVKVLDASGAGDTFDVAEGLDYVTNFRQGGSNPVKVINMSFGGEGTSETIRRAIDRASQAGLLLVASSGNEGDGTVRFPANLDNVIAVGAVDGRRQRAHYSNYGSALDVVAPGGDDERDDDGDGTNDYIFQQTYDPNAALLGQYDQFVTLGIMGTSSAAPHVAALAALLFSQGIGDALAVRAAIEQTALDLGASGRDDQFGHGLINPAKALSGLGLNQ